MTERGQPLSKGQCYIAPKLSPSQKFCCTTFMAHGSHVSRKIVETKPQPIPKSALGVFCYILSHMSIKICLLMPTS